MDSHELFEILMREQADMLTSYLRCVLRDETAVDDVFQETMLVAWRRLSDFDRSKPFGPWLRGIAGRMVMAHRRDAAKSPLLLNETVLGRLDEVMTQIQQQTGDTFGEQITALRECIKELPEAAQAAIKLRYEQDCSPPQIAEQLSISVEATKKRMQRSRSKLLACIQRKMGINQ